MDILIVDDEKAIRDSMTLALEAEDHYCEAVDSLNVALLRLKEELFDLAFVDLRLGEDSGLDLLKEIRKRHPSVQVVLITAHGTVDVAVKAIQAGALDFLEKPFTPSHLRRVLAQAERNRKLTDRIEELEVAVSGQQPEPIFESRDDIMKSALEVLFRAAATPASVLILGESGTGKSVVARTIHERSHLRDKPFVTVHCPSLSRELLESELFGHVKGAFTGAMKDKWGKVRAANGGTLFLDEIGELPMDIQPKLLRLLQEREYERVGDTKTHQADVRVVAATNRDLKRDIAAGNFREDLFYRLNVISVVMPSLRERPNDLIDFARKFVDFFASQSGRSGLGFSQEALAQLAAYPWPGNLRELRNAVERAVILATGSEIQPSDLPSIEAVKTAAMPVSPTAVARHHAEGAAAEAMHSDGNEPTTATPALGANVSLQDLEEAHLRSVLARADSMQEAAQILGIDQATLYRKRKKMGLN